MSDLVVTIAPTAAQVSELAAPLTLTFTIELSTAQLAEIAAGHSVAISAIAAITPPKNFFLWPLG